ncbi:MraY family glycosyltransferase [Treponema sp. OMZ 805]|uniref:MraY family glycosyltransferase n=1 Tax=Treponema sp. OMZ 805 TaxID=2726068 RepID=UPI003D8AD4D4
MQLTNMQFILFTMLIPCTISAFFVYLVILFAKRHNLYDDVGGRKIHTGKIPRLGGVGFFSAFALSVFIVYFKFPSNIVITRQFTAIIVGGCLIFFMGLWDDLKNWRAIYKLIVQLIAAGIVAYADFRFTRISFGPLGLFIPFGIFAYPITILWIAGVTNAVNLMDGIDGQVGCLSVSLLISYIILFFKDSSPHFSMIYTCIILAAAIIGFLFFNLSRPKAKIFMGDAGSQFLGFVLAILPLVPRNDGYETAALPFAIIFMMLPIFDMIAAIWRRIRDKKPIREGDRLHLHHKLMLIGYSPRGALVTVMILQIIIDIFVTLAVISQGLMALVTLIGLSLVGILFFTLIHFEKEKHLAHDGTSIPKNTQ